MMPTPQLLQWSDKNPNDFVDYAVDWFAVLNALQDTIQAVNWFVPSGLLRGGESVQGNITSIFLGGGTAGVTYTVSCEITTAGGRIIRRQILLRVKNI
jgi:hypothetical protein